MESREKKKTQNVGEKLAGLIFFAYFCNRLGINGGLAQLARALAWHARGHRFDPDILHNQKAAQWVRPSVFIREEYFYSFFPIF